MHNIIISEFAKLKRYSIIWVGIVTIIFSVGLAAFQSSFDGSIVLYKDFYNNVIWNNFSLAFPFLIVLIGGFIINREYTDHTLKTMLTIPVTFRKMLFGKLLVTGIITGLLAAFSFFCTLTLALVFDFEGISLSNTFQSFYQIVGIALCNYIAVLPIITFFSRKQNGFFAGVGFAFFYGFCGIFVAGRNLTDFYPVTSGLSIFKYTGLESLQYNPVVSFLVLFIMIIIAVLFITITPSYDKVTTGPQKNKRKNKSKQAFRQTQ